VRWRAGATAAGVVVVVVVVIIIIVAESSKQQESNDMSGHKRLSAAYAPCGAVWRRGSSNSGGGSGH